MCRGRNVCIHLPVRIPTIMLASTKQPAADFGVCHASQKNHIYTSGASGTNAAVIRGALRAERPDLLTVILPQSLKRQPPESQELLSKVRRQSVVVSEGDWVFGPPAMLSKRAAGLMSCSRNCPSCSH